MIKEFRDFIAKGNVMDMAVGIIIGAAFTAIVASMVDDLLQPILGLVTGGTDFSNYYIAMDGNDYPTLQAARDAGAPVFAYGSFITAVINFLIIAFVVFLLVKGVNSLRRNQAEAPAAPTPSEALLTEIRDLLKTKS